MNGVTQLPSSASSSWFSFVSPSASVVEEAKEEDDRDLWIDMSGFEAISVRGSAGFISVLINFGSVRGWTMI